MLSSRDIQPGAISECTIFAPVYQSLVMLQQPAQEMAQHKQKF